MEYRLKKPNLQRRRFQSTALLSTIPSASPADNLVDSKAVDWYLQRRFKSPRYQLAFSNVFHD